MPRGAFLIRTIDFLTPYVLKYKNATIAWQQFLNGVSWPRFWTIHIWILTLFFVFVTFKETVDCVEKEKLLRIFFGWQ